MLGPPLETTIAGGSVPSLVAGWWSSTVSGCGTVTPDGVVDLMWSRSSGPWIAGPDNRPRPVSMQPGVEVLGLQLRPGVAQGLLQCGVDQVADRQVPLSTVLSRHRFAKLEDELESSRSSQQVIHRLSSSLAEWIPESWTPDALVIQAARRFRSGESPDLDGLSQRQFRRRFRATMGVTPTFYRRLTRVDRFTTLLDGHPQRTISELAAGAGYFDESHLSRDCLAICGATPGQLRPGR